MAKKTNKNKALTVNSSINDLSNRLLIETDLEEFNKIKNLFDLNLKKKEIVRLGKLSELQELTINEMSNRLINRSDCFNNQDLLNYFKTIEDAISRGDTSLDNINTTNIQITQNQINMTSEDTLDRQSKQKVLEAVKAILNKANSIDTSNAVEVDYTLQEKTEDNE